jgi:hypothetical protein
VEVPTVIRLLWTEIMMATAVHIRLQEVYGPDIMKIWNGA